MKREDVDRSKLSPMMKQYMDIKDEHLDELLFFRLGDFYELFFQDAETASHELELTLTGKSAGLEDRVPMCGVPFHAVKIYLEKLLKKGYKVAICEQVEDPKSAKGMVRREVVDVLTEGTFVDLDFLSSKEFNFIGGLLDLGYLYILTYVELSTGEVKTIFINHTETDLINEIINLNLKELVIKSNFDSLFVTKIKSIYNIQISYNDEYLNNEYNSIYKDIEDERVIESVKHILYYLSVKQLKDLSHLNKVTILNKDDYLKMDSHTIRNLEIFETIRQHERKNSLIWLLDKTKTAAGARKLKNWLMYPLKNKDKINERYDYIDLLNKNFLHREELANNLYEVYDLERLCGKIVCGSLNAKDVLQIKNSIKVLPNINRCLKEIKLPFELLELKELYELLESSINEDAPVSLKEGSLIKHGYSQELDELKSIRSGGKEFISSLESELKKETKIQTLKVGYNRVFGYYIEVSKGQADKVPESWERRQTLANAERFITPELKEKESLVLNAEEKIIELEYELFCEIRNILKDNLTKLQTIAYTLSEIDAYVSLSIVSEEYHLIRPILNETGEVLIKDGRHPVVEIVNQNQYIKNDIIMNDEISTLLITGPNMSGKSTYMRQFAIIVLLAQIGSFIPASDANLPIFDAIYTRIGASDDLVSGESTFMVEMLEAKNAICNATKDSLILFDELGRGTSTYDGMSLAASILEYISTKIKCKTMFSTHYHELTDLENKISNIKNVHVEAKEENGNIIFLHKVLDGAVDKSYGIHVASLAGLPKEIIKNANEYLRVYENKDIHHDDVQLSLDFNSSNDELSNYIKTLNIVNMTPIDAMNVLNKIIDMNNEE